MRRIAFADEMPRISFVCFVAAATLGACSSTASPAASTPQDAGTASSDASADANHAADTGPTSSDASLPRLVGDITPVTSVSQAEVGVVIPPFRHCQAPKAGETGAGDGGMVCTNVGPSGCTEAGKYYPDYAACDVVRTQRPYGPSPLAGTSDPNDPRLQDAGFMTELAWVTSQLRASACTCCHDSTQVPDGGAPKWDITAKPIWTDTASTAAVALFSGLSDSAVFGHYAPADNNGFERTTTGIPSTDATRMQTFWFNELARRGVSQSTAAATPPFGAALLDSLTAAPQTCPTGIGMDANGMITWGGGAGVRYVYVLDVSAKNPTLPPDGDLPTGTLWRLDVLASADGITHGVTYGTTPTGSFQAFPTNGRAPALVHGTTYHLFVLVDVAYLSQNCLFTFQG